MWSWRGPTVVSGDTELDRRIDAPRAATTREWEVLVRESESDPLTHAGSLSAPTIAVAREQASALFGWSASALWLCPADEVRRFQSQTLSVDGEASDP